jgi:ankyrin repeat protein
MALYLALKSGYLVIVEILIQSSTNINTRMSKGVIPLYRAVIYGYKYIIRVLLESGADFIKPLLIRNRLTILYIASYFGFTDII